MGEKRNAYKILVGKLEETDYYKEQDIGWWTILK
jgi:hypothetical protein